MEPSSSPMSAAPVQRAMRRLTQEQIERAMELERRPFRPPGLDLYAQMGSIGAEVLKIIAEAKARIEANQDIEMEYKERVLRQFAAKGYVEVIDYKEEEEDDDGVDEEWERDNEHLTSIS